MRSDFNIIHHSKTSKKQDQFTYLKVIYNELYSYKISYMHCALIHCFAMILFKLN